MSLKLFMICKSIFQGLILYFRQDLLRESIHVILIKLLNMKEIKNIKIFEQFLEKFLIR